MSPTIKDKNHVIKAAIDLMSRRSSQDTSGHDYWHSIRVWKISQEIAKYENSVNDTVLQLAAILHEVTDWKLDNKKNGQKILRQFLSIQPLSKQAKQEVEKIISEVSFKGANVEDSISSIEGKIVQDADRLDALGAIGIARAFSYGGAHNRSIYDPSLKPKMHDSFSEYKLDKSTSINHFYEKLLLLKGRMHTKQGKRMAKKRHEIIENYLKQFLLEWGVDE